MLHSAIDLYSNPFFTLLINIWQVLLFYKKKMSISKCVSLLHLCREGGSRSDLLCGWKNLMETWKAFITASTPLMTVASTWSAKSNVWAYYTQFIVLWQMFPSIRSISYSFVPPVFSRMPQSPSCQWPSVQTFHGTGHLQLQAHHTSFDTL